MNNYLWVTLFLLLLLFSGMLVCKYCGIHSKIREAYGKHKQMARIKPINLAAEDEETSRVIAKSE